MFMKNFTTAMVGLDFSTMDEILVQKALNFSQLAGIEKLYFIHVSKDLSLPDEIRTQYPDLLAPIDESLEEEIKRLVAKYLSSDALKIEIIVEEGNPKETILRKAKIKDVDLLIMGRKPVLEGSGTLAKDLAQKAPCSVLFFTEDQKSASPQKIMVSLDFSEHSVLSLEFAYLLSKVLRAEIVCFHLYEVPIGYHKTGKSYEEFAEIMKGHAEKDYKKLLEKHNLPSFECIFYLKGDQSKGDFVVQEAKAIQADMLFLGSRGRTNSAAFLLGSFAEKVVNLNNEIPMLIFKKKRETMSFLEALFKI
jgi:nucleotide-binding universal stress UspA family protein